MQGSFFGLNHEWSSDKRKSFFSEENIMKKLKGFQIDFSEEEKDAKSTNGKMVHWHIFHVVAQKE